MSYTKVVLDVANNIDQTKIDELRAKFVKKTGRNRAATQPKSPIVDSLLKLDKEQLDTIVQKLSAAKKQYFTYQVEYYNGMSPEQREKVMAEHEANGTKKRGRPFSGNSKPFGKSKLYICAIDENGDARILAQTS